MPVVTSTYMIIFDKLNFKNEILRHYYQHHCAKHCKTTYVGVKNWHGFWIKSIHEKRD